MTLLDGGLGLALGLGLGLAGGYLLPKVVNKNSVDYEAVKESIRDIITDYDYDDGSYAPVFLRLAWHQSGTYCSKSKTGGSNGSTMRFPKERGYGANAGLHLAQQKLDEVKRQHPNISFADLYILAAYVGIEEMGGPVIPFVGGRTDSTNPEDQVEDGRLPDAMQGSDHTRDVLGRQGFSDREMVALVAGGHSVGRCHTDRSGFEGPWTDGPTTFSNMYCTELLKDDWEVRKWNGPKQYLRRGNKNIMMLENDMWMKRDPEFRKYVEIYAKDQDALFKDFAKAFKKMTENGFVQ